MTPVDHGVQRRIEHFVGKLGFTEAEGMGPRPRETSVDLTQVQPCLLNKSVDGGARCLSLCSSSRLKK